MEREKRGSVKPIVRKGLSLELFPQHLRLHPCVFCGVFSLPPCPPYCACFLLTAHYCLPSGKVFSFLAFPQVSL